MQKNDVEKVFVQIDSFTKRALYNKIVLGKACGHPLYFLSPILKISAPNLLIAGSFHGGEEPAGTLGIMRFLETFEPTDKINVSFLPLVNPSGFALGQRLNSKNENPNHGFCNRIRENEVLSEEGSILMAHLETLKQASSNGFLTLHEDCDEKRFYLFTFENSEKPGPFTTNLFETERQFFEPITEDVLDDPKYGIRYFADGVCFNDCDGTFEDRLFHEGVPYVACTETPGLQSIESRILANVALIQAFINWLSTG